MITIRFRLRHSLRADGLGSLYLRITANRQSRYIRLGVRLYPHEWNIINQQLVFPEHDAPRYALLTRYQKLLDDSLSRVTDLIQNADNSNYPLTAEGLADAFRLREGHCLLYNFTHGQAQKLLQTGKVRTARAYETAVRRLLNWYGNNNLSFNQLDENLIKNFEEALRLENLAPNSISFYMRNLRSIYNKAVKSGLTAMDCNPFAEVFTGICKTRKRALRPEELRKFNSLAGVLSAETNKELKNNAGLYLCWRLFMVSFHARGMSFVDMAYLRKTDIKNGIIRYRRKKTGTLLEIGINNELRKLIDSFGDETKGSEYVLPIIRDITKPRRQQYESGLRLYNQRLKRLAGMINLRHPLSSHVSRHSWASMAKQQLLPLPVISEGLGHSNPKTTAIYLTALDQGLLDKACEIVSASLNENIPENGRKKLGENFMYL